MNTTLKGLLVGLTFMMGAGQGMAVSPIASGTVIQAGTYGDGRVYFVLSVSVLEPGCNGQTIEIPPTASNAKQVLQTAMVALALGKTLAVKTNGCVISPYQSLSRPTIDDTTASFVILNSY